MSLLKNVNTTAGVQEEKDILGGGSKLLESGAYPAKIVTAYVTESQKGAVGVAVHLKTEDGHNLRETIYITSGRDKGQKNYTENEKGEKRPLPGFTVINSLTRLTVDQEILDMETEQKVTGVYDFDKRAEVPTKVEMLVPLIGKEVIVGVLKQTVDKNVAGGDGVYRPSGETRDVNTISKVFHADTKLTIPEIIAEETEPKFYEQWVAKWTGKTDVRAKGASGAGTSGAPTAGANAGAPKRKLFSGSN